MLIVFLTNDLVFPSRVAGVAQRLGAQFITAASADALLEKLTAEGAPSAIVLLDLNSPVVDSAAIVPRLKSIASPPEAIIAFGPHVHEAKLAAAQSAGCELVLTRGQFDAQMDAIFARYLSSAGPES